MARAPKGLAEGMNLSVGTVVVRCDHNPWKNRNEIRAWTYVGDIFGNGFDLWWIGGDEEPHEMDDTSEVRETILAIFRPEDYQ